MHHACHPGDRDLGHLRVPCSSSCSSLPGFTAPSALAAPLPGSAYDSQDGNQLTNTSPAALDWQNVAPQAFLSTNLDNQANDGCYSGGTETQPNGWAFTNTPGGCSPGKSDILGMWTHGEITPTQNFLHAAFVRRQANGSTFITFELNQKATTWVNGTGTTIPCRSTGDILIAYDLNGSSRRRDLLPLDGQRQPARPPAPTAPRARSRQRPP